MDPNTALSISITTGASSISSKQTLSTALLQPVATTTKSTNTEVILPPSSSTFVSSPTVTSLSSIAHHIASANTHQARPNSIIAAVHSTPLSVTSIEKSISMSNVTISHNLVISSRITNSSITHFSSATPKPQVVTSFVVPLVCANVSSCQIQTGMLKPGEISVNGSSQSPSGSASPTSEITSLPFTTQSIPSMLTSSAICLCNTVSNVSLSSRMTPSVSTLPITVSFPSKSQNAIVSQSTNTLVSSLSGLLNSATYPCHLLSHSDALSSPMLNKTTNNSFSSTMIQSMKVGNMPSSTTQSSQMTTIAGSYCAFNISQSNVSTATTTASATQCNTIYSVSINDSHLISSVTAHASIVTTSVLFAARASLASQRVLMSAQASVVNSSAAALPTMVSTVSYGPISSVNNFESLTTSDSFNTTVSVVSMSDSIQSTSASTLNYVLNSSICTTCISTKPSNASMPTMLYSSTMSRSLPASTSSVTIPSQVSTTLDITTSSSNASTPLQVSKACSPTSLPTSLVTPDETCYLRFSSLIFRRAPLAVRKYFDSRHPPAMLSTDLTNHKQSLQNIKGTVITQYQWDILYPTSGRVVKSTDFDITLLICLLRNMTKVAAPARGFDKLPHATDVSVGADLARIKYYRNQIAHTNDAKLSATVFNVYWNDVQDAIGRLGGNIMMNEVKQLRVSPLDESDREIMLEMSKLKWELMQPIPNNIYEVMMNEISIWRHEDLLFAETDFSRKVYQFAKSKQFVSVIGNPGCGKSATIHHVALRFEQEGFLIVPVKTPKEIMEYHKAEMAQIFVVDDPCGEHFVDQHLANEWSRYEKSLQNLKSTAQQCNSVNKLKILFALRLIVFKSLKNLSQNIVCANVLNINDSENMLTTADRKAILKSYVMLELNLDDEVLQKHDSFPLLCRLFSKIPGFIENPQKYLDNPYEEYEKELDQLRHNAPNDSPHHYCALVLCMLFDNTFCFDMLDKKHAMRHAVEEVYDACGLDSGTSKFKIQRAIECLTGVYIYDKWNSFQLIHTTLRNTIAWHFSKESLALLIDHASISLWNDRVRPLGKLPNDLEGDNMLIFLSDSSLQMFIKRVVNEMRKFNFTDIFHIQFFPNNKLERLVYAEISSTEYFKEMSVPLLPQEYTYVDSSDEINIGDCEIIGIYKPEDYFYENLLALNLLHGCDFIFYVIRYGWLTLLEIMIEAPNSKIVNKILQTKETSFTLSLLSKNQIMIKRMCEICFTSPQEDIEQLCLACNSKLEKGHWDLCPFIGLKPAIVLCLTGNQTILDFLFERGIYDANTFNFAVQKDSDSLTPLTACSRFDHVSMLNTLLEKGVDINFPDNSGSTALIEACACGHTEIVSILLRNGAEIEHKGERRIFYLEYMPDWLSALQGPNEIKKGWTGLWWACYCGHYDIVLALLSHGANISFQNNDGKTPLWIACIMGHYEIVSLLIQKGAVVDGKDSEGRTPLWWACHSGKKKTVTLLLEAGACVNAHDNFGRSPLYTFCYRGHAQIASILINHKSLVNRKEENQFSSLIGGCCSRTFKVVQLLVDNGADVNVSLKNGITPLAIACYQGNEETVSLLLRKGANVNQTDNFGKTPLLWACSVSEDTQKILNSYHDVANIISDDLEWYFKSYFQKKHAKVVLVLLRNGATINIEDNNKKFPIFYTLNDFENTSNLLDFGADVNLQNSEGKSVLHMASVFRSVEIMEMLISKGADIEAVDENGRIPLHYASSNNKCTNVKLLLERGANINTRNKRGQTPLFEASYSRCIDALKELLKRGGDTNILDEYGYAPLHAAVQGHNSYPSTKFGKETVSILLKYGAKIDQKDSDGNTPLHIACNTNNVVIADLLIKSGANINVWNNDRFTPLFCSYLLNLPEMMKLLVNNGADIEKTVRIFDDFTAMTIMFGIDYNTSDRKEDVFRKYWLK